MFGSLRLALAIAVALSYVGVSWKDRHIGVMAVIVFFMLSGYVVAGLLAPGSALARSRARFYVERAARLLPLYYAFALVGGLLAIVTRPESPFLQGTGTPFQWLANLLIIPLNYGMFVSGVDHFMLIPPAWSLGLEIQFYLLAPWILGRDRAIIGAMTVTLAIGAAAHLGKLHGDWFGYRLLCGNLYIFLSGAWLYRVHHQAATYTPLVAVWSVNLLLFVLTGFLGRWGVPFSFEVLAAYLAGLPLLAWLGRQPRTAWDDRLGQLAYGTFLGHFAVIWAFSRFGWITPSAHPLPIYVALVLAAALLGHVLIERPLLDWRRRLR